MSTIPSKTQRKVYIFDTNAFLSLHNHHTQVIELPQQLWDLLAQMMQSGEIISHIFVYDEIVNEKAEHPDMLTQWLIPRKHCFHKDTPEQAVMVGEIVEKFPKLIDPAHEKEQADPWIIAQAVLLTRQPEFFAEIEYIVVTQEKKTSPQKIPAACSKYKIKSMNLKEFFEAKNISIGLRTTALPSLT